MGYAKSIAELIGKTPLLELSNYERKHGLQAKLLAKMESLNPSGSVKDRTALSMIETAEKEGRLNEGSVIIEPTSGNTGIGLASLAAARGYRLILVMPDTMSEERRKLLKGYGAELVLTEGVQGMAGSIRRAQELKKEIPNSMIAGQFENEANPRIHELTTGPEIWEDLDGQVDVLVAGAGTGGTLTGTGRYLKEKNPKIQVVAVEPAGSPVLSGGTSGPHMLQGIGAGFIPAVLDTNVYDEVVAVKDEDAIQTAKEIGKTEGILVGISAGAAVWAAKELAKRQEMQGKNMVVILPDHGDRYLSTAIFED